MTALDDLIDTYEAMCLSCHTHIKKSCKYCRIPELTERAKKARGDGV
jgi:hypothetical protein